MTGFNHVLAGVAIVSITRHPVVAMIASLLSHFALDMMPHFGGVAWFNSWNKRLRVMIIVDMVLSLLTLVVGLFLFPANRALVVVCAALTTLPDWLWVLHFKFDYKHKFFDFHQAIQRFERPWGAYIEACFALTLVGTLFVMHN